ncbi:extracellular solute-binding protein [Pseudactinotalea suaedae]|uniref:extracellular solute-binding protein n=1 Tax=Pseudactinotalea suaedae TaxID=1524924 RepID=UPI00139178F9|nr:extracellular solute-binding protein [Pseudactinotalea suaedae]
MSDSLLDRRTFLGAGLGAAAIVAVGSMASCSTPTAPTGGSVAGAGVELPSYIRFAGVTADIPGTDAGIPDTFFAYPANPQPATTELPADGSAIRGSVPINKAVPPSMDRNSYWQELNARIGSDLSLTITPGADFAQRFATAVAGDGLGDVFTVDLGFAQLPQFLETQCQDLTEYLAGDAVADYPFLANLPTDSWRGTVFNGAIYGLPITRGVQSSVLLYTRRDLFEARGVDPQPTTIDEFLQTCQAMTDVRSNVWALTAVPMSMLQQMYGLPNTWGVDEAGVFTHALETDGYKDALELGRRLIADELVHPDSVDASTADQKLWFGAGSGAIHQDTYSGMGSMYEVGSGGPENYAVGLMVTPSESGEPAPLWLGNPNNTISALKQADESRIRMLLEVLNWLAAPIGTAEHMFRKYGVEGVHHELDDNGDPVMTPLGDSEASGGTFPIEYLIDGPRPSYYPGRPHVAQDIYDHMEVVIPTGVRNPTVGLYSTTQGTNGGRLTTMANDAANAILLGREPVSSWDEVATDWRSGGGDTIRAEYEEAYAQTQA